MVEGWDIMMTDDRSGQAALSSMSSSNLNDDDMTIVLEEEAELVDRRRHCRQCLVLSLCGMRKDGRPSESNLLNDDDGATATEEETTKTRWMNDDEPI